MKPEGAAVSEPRVTVQPVATREEAQALAEELAKFPHGIFSMRIVAESADGGATGYIVRSASGGAEILGWGHARLRDGAAELSWETHPSHRCHGYMREAAPSFVEALLSRPDVEKAYAWIPASNTASREVARACGMTLTDAQGGPGEMWVRRRRACVPTGVLSP
jgi:RimJ/RimL family protein N-acetyltransferase